MARILILGNHKLVGSGIAALLRQEGDFEVYGPIGLEDWQSSASQINPHLVVIISSSSDRDPQSERVAAEIGRQLSHSRLIFVSLARYERGSLSALSSLVDHIIGTDTDESSFVECVRDVISDDRVQHDVWARSLTGKQGTAVSRMGVGKYRDVLTAREKVILRLIAQGESNKAIAHRLSISEHTVRAHTRNIMQKLAVDNRVQAAAIAMRMGLTTR